MAKKALAACATIAVLLFATTAFAQQASEKSVRELMDLTGAGNLSGQVMQQLLPAMKQMAGPKVPPSFWDEFEKEIDFNELVDLVVPIYQQNFTEEEVRAAIAFYHTAAGQKIIRQTPVVMQQSMAVGQRWGQLVAQRAVAKLKALEQPQ